MIDEKKLAAKREAVRKAINEYRREVKLALDDTPRGSGHALNEYDHYRMSIVQIDSAKRVLWLED
jgi:EAL domain-containing protein (putative c-di-GMP-specific phosphodiesterase class I)